MKRIYIHDAVYDAVRDELVALAQTMKVGNPFDPAVSIGPVQSRGQYERLRFVSPFGRRSIRPTHVPARVSMHLLMSPLQRIDLGLQGQGVQDRL